jgi:hypothetical protein
MRNPKATITVHFAKGKPQTPPTMDPLFFFGNIISKA